MMEATLDFTLTPAQVQQGLDKLPSLPAVVVELMHCIDDEGADTETLARKIAQDQALVAKMLRIANSSFYGLQGQVNSIPEAVVVLGLRGVRNLATAAALAGSFSKVGSEGGDFRYFWQHSTAVALCTRALARHLKINEENAFAAGLLHDIGRLVLAGCFPQHLAAARSYRRRLDCEWIDAERALLGIDHGQIGLELAQRWKFPPLMCAAIADHHSPGRQASRSLAGIVHVADAIVHALDLCGDEDEIVPRLHASSWEQVKLSWDDSRKVFAEVESKFKSASETFAA